MDHGWLARVSLQGSSPAAVTAILYLSHLGAPPPPNIVAPVVFLPHYSRTTIAHHGIPSCSQRSNVQVLAQDLLNPTPASEARKHKLKKLVQAPNSFFMVRHPPRPAR